MRFGSHSLGLARLVLGLSWLGCADEPPPVEAVAAVAQPEVVEEDLLAQARKSISDGRIAPDIADALLASNEPGHARARRILRAMDAREGTDEAPAPEPAPSQAIAPAPEPPPVASANEAPPSEAQPNEAVAKAPPPPPVRPRASLQGLDLRSSKQGAVLTLRATGNVVVGVANQPGSGIVRLVVEASDAAEAALRARPSIDGVRVTSVQRAGRSLFVTLQLEPGWTLGKVRQFGGGAKVELRRVG